MTPVAPLSSTAPLSTAIVVAVLIRSGYTTVILLTEHVDHESSADLRTWLWGVPRAYRGRAAGTLFRAEINSVKIEATRLTAWMDANSSGVVMALTGATPMKSAPLIGYHVGKLVMVSIERIGEQPDPRQTVIGATLPDGAAKGKRIKVELSS